MYELLGRFMRRKRLLYISFNHASSIYLPDSITYGSRGGGGGWGVMTTRITRRGRG